MRLYVHDTFQLADGRWAALGRRLKMFLAAWVVLSNYSAAAPPVADAWHDLLSPAAPR